MSSRITSLASQLLLIMIVIGTIAVIPVCDANLAFMANNNNQLGVEVETTFGTVDVPIAGHVGLGYQRDDGKFVFGSFGPSPGNLPLWAPGTLTVETFDDWAAVERYLITNYYTTYKIFNVDNPDPQGAWDTMERFKGSYYNLLTSVVDIKNSPLAGLAGTNSEHPDSENCLTFAKKILEAYGVQNLPPVIPFITSAPNNYFLSVPGEIHSTVSDIEQESTSPPLRPNKALEGSWEGKYYYSDGRAPVKFSATITQNGNEFSGRTQEPNTFGDPSAPLLFANLVGSVTGDSITFVKTYDGTGNVNHSVNYSGTLDTNTKKITGTWTINSSNGVTTGTFDMSFV